MRIQHNIMAMSAYRNYTNNVAAMKKNLEKLSSGYKINRAGDDAAGLAISEKMRAQITGLETAQKNAKDGISLVQTAEGALTEVHDMLNRMVELATQSANGTYDNTTDRAQLQKELDQLRTEIDRIADSSNFNGINLLDGSMSSAGIASRTKSFDLPEVGQILGTNTVLHNEAQTNGGTEFSVDLHNFEFSNNAGDSMTVTVGSTAITLTAGSTADGTALSGDDLVAKFAGNATGYTVTVGGKAFTGASGETVQIDGKEFTMSVTDGADGKHLTFKQVDAPTTEADEVNGAKTVTLSGNVNPVKAQFEIDLTGKTSGTITIGTKAISFASHNALKTALANASLDGFTAEMSGAKITLTAASAGKVDAPKVTLGNATKSSVAKVAGATGAAAATASIAVTGVTLAAGSLSFAIVEGSNTYTATIANFGTAESGTIGSYNFSVDNAGNITLTAKTAGSAGNQSLKVAKGANTAAAEAAAKALGTANVTITNGKDAVAQKYTVDVTGWDGGTLKMKNGANSEVTLDYDAVKAGTATVNGYTASLSSDGTTLTLTAKTAGAVTGATAMGTAANAVEYTKDTDALDVTTVKEGVTGGAIQNITQGVNGDWNVSTTDIKNVYAGGRDRLASTYFDLTNDMVAEGAKIKIADETYTFTYKANATGANMVDLSKLDAKASDFLSMAAKKLTEAAASNKVYTVGHDGSRITVTETKEHADLADKTNKYPGDDWDLSTMEGIAKSLGYSTASVDGKSLTLQIGDTAEDFNQLKVDIQDCHADSMGIGDIDISTQEGAAEAVKAIKAAINYVSDVRGTLGATQNRLDHTINNLSVMTENIQDAESTIRDTDVAEEMMAYTKNNILIQSAQAMLAQANQVPQGVLQLLQ